MSKTGWILIGAAVALIVLSLAYGTQRTTQDNAGEEIREAAESSADFVKDTGEETADTLKDTANEIKRDLD